MPKIRIAFIKFNGLASGGTERWLQSVAACLNKDAFEATYFYTGKSDPDREKFLLSHGVRLVRVAAEDKTASRGEWVNTDLFKKFDESRYDIIQTAIAGRREWPYYLFRKPVAQCVTYDSGVDFSLNVHHTFHLSSWWRKRWIAQGGSRRRSSVVAIGVEEPADAPGIRESLGIPQNALVAGFHQRADDNIFSPVPLEAFASLARDNSWFIILGGSAQYGEQAARLGLKNFLQLPHTADRRTISSFLRTLDIFAHGRKDGETLGYVFIEALMHKLPCLAHAARANAHKETMGPGGLWAENEAEYARQLKRLFAEPDLRQRLAAQGESFARETYSNARAIAHIEHVYIDICDIYKNSALYILLHKFTLYISICMRYLLRRILRRLILRFADSIKGHK
ncbi:MAG: glycosyltransferase family 4 protein [Desulfovibrionaceae bacterium]|nr:glycosyltransferase family 4 protein [Desulfovibrionaceae bacterium]